MGPTRSGNERTHRKPRRVALGVAACVALIGLLPAQEALARPICDSKPGWRFTNVRFKRTQHVRFPGERDFVSTNASSVTQHVGASQSVSGTVSLGVSVSVEAKAGFAIVAEVKSSITASATRSISRSRTYSVDITIPPHKTAHAFYGVSRAVVRGHLYKLNSICQIVADKGRVTARVPNGLGWRIWFTR
jgi:hypothetical protein